MLAMKKRGYDSENSRVHERRDHGKGECGLGNVAKTGVFWRYLTTAPF